jgi:hypothetical protein
MQETTAAAKAKYDVNIEGTIHPWPHRTITAAQIRELAGFADTQPIIEIELHDNQAHAGRGRAGRAPSGPRVRQEGEVPARMTRIGEELELLRGWRPDLRLRARGPVGAAACVRATGGHMERRDRMSENRLARRRGPAMGAWSR